ncbi:bifunctional 3-oxoadipate enol-lactonase/4-carboxymuconolactone decarboxylase PcaDC [Streptomyces violascens]|uniref:3-oxoadipate enol-lactonase n=1 Tax=Streptomyces violascens TaxID=67381 RepID=A0ABQ3QEG8_9ACTN|nr:alpha/beta fold hydrolase [Streptomyces violascens]GGU00941.1 3-oxoadipate enol-lactonase [Streptomyces violascens]GHI35650.1 3-oxoadipate enol-lactonase [Streptomyces violascens]
MLTHHLTPGPTPTAPTLVLAPSLGTTLALWNPQLSALAAHFNILRWDLPGHGNSPAWLPPSPRPTLETLATLLLDLLEELRTDTFSYAGISLGGAVGTWLAAHHPDRVESLALLCTSADFGPPEPWLARADTVRTKGIGEVVDSAPSRWFTPAFDAPEHLLADHHRVDPGSYAACCEILAGLDLRPELARITAPTLVIAGRDDVATPPSHARELADGIRDAQLLELPRAGHLANVEQPNHVTEALLGHLTNTRTGPPLRRTGEATRRAVLGNAHVDRARTRTTPFTARFQDFITRYAWGEIWGDGTLDRRTRSVITLTALVAGGHKDELALHVQGALRNGLSPDEIGEVLLQCAVYCSVPAANSAFAVAERAITEYAADADQKDS